MNTGLAVSIVPAFCLLVGACAATMAVPDALRPGPEASLDRVVPARGVQIYECRSTGARHEWAFVAPDAELLDRNGYVIGHHGAGPYWQSRDGSRVVASVKARADAPTAGAIPWLLLASRDQGARGAFSQVTAIQRINTTGGVAPASGCSAQTAGQQVRVPYTADYIFFTSNSKADTHAKRAE